MEKGKRHQGSSSWANIGPADQRGERAEIEFPLQEAIKKNSAHTISFGSLKKNWICEGGHLPLFGSLSKVEVGQEREL